MYTPVRYALDHVLHQLSVHHPTRGHLRPNLSDRILRHRWVAHTDVLFRDVVVSLWHMHARPLPATCRYELDHLFVQLRGVHPARLGMYPNVCGWVHRDRVVIAMVRARNIPRTRRNL